MNRNWNLIWMALMVLGLNGCASMSGDECITSDWAAIGYEDGARGYTTDRITERRKACAKHGVTPDFAAYQSGREQGLAEYCQPGRGFNVGSNGGRYNGICSVDLEADFLEAYNAGRHLYTLRGNVNRASSAINSKQNEIDRIKDDMRLKEAALISDETTTEERVLLLVDLKDHSERTGQLEAEIQDLYEQRAYSQAELDNYQVALLDYGY
ncbi:MAG: DUF2799 domain-containing protein [Woeseiaceae bacterium]